VLQKTALDLGDLAADVVDQFQILAEEKGISLTAVLDPGSPAKADRTQIERLFSNLLSNAVKYTPRGGRVWVRVGPDEKPGWTRVVVEDTGVGIPPETCRISSTGSTGFGMRKPTGCKDWAWD